MTGRLNNLNPHASDIEGIILSCRLAISQNQVDHCGLSCNQFSFSSSSDPPGNLIAVRLENKRIMQQLFLAIAM